MRIWCTLLVVMMLSASTAIADERLEFSLPGSGGKVCKLRKEHRGSFTVVCFLGNECPLARHYASRLEQLRKDYQNRDVRFIGINSNQQDSLEEVGKFVKELGIQFEMVKDYDNQVAERFGATRTPEVFVVDDQLEIRYSGRIDDQYAPGVTRSEASHHFLRRALDELLEGKNVSVASVDAVGCLIGRVKQPVDHPTVTYTKDVSHLIQRHCIECHRSGEIGPFALDNYDDVKGWAAMMVEVIEQKRMPPWHATDEHRPLVNARHLTQEEKSIFARWLEEGTPFGNVNELPQPRVFTSGWRLPKKPDMVITMREQPYQVAATGTVEYQYFVVDPGFTEDKWVLSAEVVPGDRSVVHHSIVFIRPPDGSSRFRGIGWLAAYVPGQATAATKATHARLIPAGSKLVFQQHYTPSGVTTKDKTKIGLVFADPNNVTHEVFTLAGLNQEFEIPAKTNDFKVEAKLRWFPKNGELISIGPHMHYRGRSFELFCSSRGEQEQLIDIPGYDFNWQHSYEFKEPIDLSAIDQLTMEFRFDNSDENPFNPNPNELVTWGDQTWEEMAVAFFDVSLPLNRRVDDRVDLRRSADAEKDRREKSIEFVKEFFAKHDKNRDDYLIRDELPRAIGRFSFWLYDPDGDGKVTKSELEQYVRRNRFDD